MWNKLASSLTFIYILTDILQVKAYFLLFILPPSIYSKEKGVLLKLDSYHGSQFEILYQTFCFTDNLAAITVK